MILILALIAFLALAGALYYALEHERPFILREPEDWTINLRERRR